MFGEFESHSADRPWSSMSMKITRWPMAGGDGIVSSPQPARRTTQKRRCRTSRILPQDESGIVSDVAGRGARSIVRAPEHRVLPRLRTIEQNAGAGGADTAIVVRGQRFGGGAARS